MTTHWSLWAMCGGTMIGTMRRVIAASALTLIGTLFAPGVAEEAPSRYLTDPNPGNVVHGVDEIAAPSHERPGNRGVDHDRPNPKRGHEGMNDQRRHHERSPGHGGRRRPKRSQPNDALNLALVFLIPAAVGAIGGLALRARTVSTTS